MGNCILLDIWGNNEIYHFRITILISLGRVKNKLKLLITYLKKLRRKKKKEKKIKKRNNNNRNYKSVKAK